MESRRVLSADRVLLAILVVGMGGFVTLYTFLLTENTGRTVSLVQWAWFLGLGLVFVLSTYSWFTKYPER